MCRVRMQRAFCNYWQTPELRLSADQLPGWTVASMCLQILMLYTRRDKLLPRRIEVSHVTAMTYACSIAMPQSHGNCGSADIMGRVGIQSSCEQKRQPSSHRSRPSRHPWSTVPCHAILHFAYQCALSAIQSFASRQTASDQRSARLISILRRTMLKHATRVSQQLHGRTPTSSAPSSKRIVAMRFKNGRSIEQISTMPEAPLTEQLKPPTDLEKVLPNPGEQQPHNTCVSQAWERARQAC